MIKRENTLIFFFSMAVLAGPSLSLVFAYDLTQFPDSDTYLGLANFDFDQSPVRRYRLIIPFLAAALDFIGGPLFGKLAPTYFQGDFSLPFSFFLVNMMIMSWFGLLCYQYCKAHGLSPMSALIGLLVLLTSRYSYYFASLPLIDSLICVVTGMALVGIKTKNTKLLVIAIFLGPFARESFIFLAPVIFFFSHIPKGKQILYFLASGVLVFSFHHLYDRLAPVPVLNWVQADLSHLYGLVTNLPLLFSFYGAYKMAVSLGLWLFLPLIVLYYLPASRDKMKKYIKQPYIIMFFLLVLVQMLLSGSMERMFYLGMPVFSVICAMATEEFRLYYRSLPATKL